MENRPANIITEQARLADLCSELKQTGIFAFDTEFIKEESYEPQLCLMQVATDDQVALVDPLAALDPRPLWDLICKQPLL